MQINLLKCVIFCYVRCFLGVEWRIKVVGFIVFLLLALSVPETESPCPMWVRFGSGSGCWRVGLAREFGEGSRNGCLESHSLFGEGMDEL